MSVKVYHNTTEKDMNVNGVGVVPAGEKVSVASEYQAHVVLENYPGLNEISQEPGPDKAAKEETSKEA
jgi:hypothetical protein